jgi:hypothetical protein
MAKIGESACAAKPFFVILARIPVSGEQHMIIWGKSLYGSVDKVQGAFTVRTLFGHIYYIPLIPIESWLVFEGSTSKQWRGIKLPGLHWRSVGFAWARGGLVALGASAAVYALTSMGNGNQGSVVLGAAVSAASFAALWWTYRACQASYERALELVREHKLGDHFETVIEAAYGRAVTPATF